MAENGKIFLFQNTEGANELEFLAKSIAEEMGAKGAILILEKEDGSGQKIAQHGLEHSEIRECLSIATYYNEKLNLEEY